VGVHRHSLMLLFGSVTHRVVLPPVKTWCACHKSSADAYCISHDQLGGTVALHCICGRAQHMHVCSAICEALLAACTAYFAVAYSCMSRALI
jgi:hypothetical protein